MSHIEMQQARAKFDMLYLYMFLLQMPQTFADGKHSVGGIKGNRADPAEVEGGELAGGLQLGVWGR